MSDQWAGFCGQAPAGVEWRKEIEVSIEASISFFIG